MTWEQRWHPLREEWVIVAAHRNNRPWVGEKVRPRAATVPSYAADCPLCPGNVRVSGIRNDTYTGIFVFDNDHPCVGCDAPADLASPPPPYQNRPAAGAARVVCYSPLHNVALAELPVERVADLLRVWQAQYRDLGSLPGVRHVLVFRKQGRSRRSLESPPALPDLRHEFRFQDDRKRSAREPSLLERAPADITRRQHCDRAGRRAADLVRAGFRRGLRPVLSRVMPTRRSSHRSRLIPAWRISLILNCRI